MDEADFARVVEQGRALQQRLPDLRLVAVGGTAAALHCHHRYSCRRLGRSLIKLELEDRLPRALDSGFQ